MFKKVILLTLISSTLIITACSSSGSGGDASLLKIKDSGAISASDTLNYDWGDINIEGGNVSKTFSFKNDDMKKLVLKGASTSCMCTAAAIALPDGSQSPTFGMHNNPTDWAYGVMPGEEFSVKVVFDPMAHGPSATGPIQRSVFLVTSSKNNEIAESNSRETGGRITELKVKGNVLSEADYNSKNPS